jgi:hypothetical protein
LLSKIKLKKNGSNIENDNAGESSEDVEIEDGTPS